MDVTRMEGEVAYFSQSNELHANCNEIESPSKLIIAGAFLARNLFLDENIGQNNILRTNTPDI
jgi:hypothetical protein